jgi:hypothetical protein
MKLDVTCMVAQFSQTSLLKKKPKEKNKSFIQKEPGDCPAPVSRRGVLGLSRRGVPTWRHGFLTSHRGFSGLSCRGDSTPSSGVPSPSPGIPIPSPDVPIPVPLSWPPIPLSRTPLPTSTSNFFLFFPLFTLKVIFFVSLFFLFVFWISYSFIFLVFSYSFIFLVYQWIRPLHMAWFKSMDFRPIPTSLIYFL